MPDISHLFNKTVSTYRLTESKDSMFSPVSTFSVNLASLSCRIQKKKGFEPVEGGRKYSKTSHILYCAFNTDLTSKDVVSYNSDTFNVIDIDFEGNDDTYLRVSLEKADITIP